MSSAPGWLADQQTKFSSYLEKIQLAIDKDDWDGLSTLLDERQVYLETLLSSPNDPYIEALKPLLEVVLVQDQAFQAAIQAKKQVAESQQQDLTRNRKAIHLYSS